MVDGINESVEQEAKESLTEGGEELAAAVGAEIDGDTLIDAGEDVAAALATIGSVTDDDLEPELEEEYKELAAAADGVVSHLVSAGFFRAADDALPPFDTDFIDDCLVQALQSAREDSSLFETAGVKSDLSGFVSEAIDHTGEIEENVRWEPEKPEKESPMTTRGATEGVVDWLDDLGRHLWMSEELLSEEMVDDASTHTRALGAALLLIAQGAAGLDDDTNPADDAAKIIGGIALHTYYQHRLPEDLSWITDEMRAPGAWAGD